MGAFTNLTGGDVAALAHAFGAGEVERWWPIPAGTINSNFGLKTARGRYFLRVNEGKGEAEVRYEADLVGELSRAGLPVLAPIPAQGGEPFARRGGKLVSLFPFRDGEHRARGEVGEHDARAVGAALADLHAAGLPIAARFDRRGIYTFGDIVRRLEGIAAPDGDAELARALKVLGAEAAWLEAREAVRTEATRGVIHGDLFRDNVLFRGSELVLLLDFEQASTGSLAYDLAVCINAWCWGDDLERPLSRALVAGYRARRELPPPDRDALYVELRAAAMRFAVTRITDVYLPGIENPDKDYRRYVRRLERWQALGPDEVASFLAL